MQNRGKYQVRTVIGEQYKRPRWRERHVTAGGYFAVLVAAILSTDWIQALGYAAVFAACVVPLFKPRFGPRG